MKGKNERITRTSGSLKVSNSYILEHYFILNSLDYVNLNYRPFHKTLPRSSAIVNCISVRFYEADCKKTELSNKII